MRKTGAPRFAWLLAGVVLCLAAGPERASAQSAWWRLHGMVLDEAGHRVPPTPETAIRALLDGEEPGQRGAPARAVPTQLFEPRSGVELDAFAARLVGLALADDTSVGQVRRQVLGALSASARPEQGIPYEGAFASLVQLFDTYVRDLPADERNDPLAALRRHAGQVPHRAAANALGAIRAAEPQGRGRDFLLGLIAAAPVPETRGAGARASTWCVANNSFFLTARILGKSKEEALREVPVDPVLFEDICGAGAHIHP